MRTIRMYELPFFANGEKSREINLYDGAIPLKVEYESGKPQVWFEVETERPVHKVRLQIYDTCWEIPLEGEYLGSLLCDVFVWHWYMIRL